MIFPGRYSKSSGLLAFACIALLACGDMASNQQLTQQSPNVVFILADDLGWTQTSAYGSRYYKTPNLEKLASQGVRYTNAYAAAAICSPTRASIMTGKYPARLHITDYIPGRAFSNMPLKQPDWQRHLPLSEYTLGELFREQGYRTALFGKWHLSKEKAPPGSIAHNPSAQGFDESFITYKPLSGPAREWQTPEDDGHNVRMLTDLSLKFIERNANRPFFLMISHNTIHDPLIEKSKLIESFASNPESNYSENSPVIAAMLDTFDRSVGAVLDKLDELGLAENTLVIFFSDNGGLESDASQLPLREGKAWLYEGGIRVPLIIRWPGRFPENTVDYSLVSSTDFFPTFMEVLGQFSDVDDIDGYSLLPGSSERTEGSERALYWHYPHYHNAGMSPAGAIRIGNMKLIEWFGSAPEASGTAIELYDLSKDIGETDNLVHRQPEVAQKLLNMLAVWRTEVGAQMPEERPD